MWHVMKCTKSMRWFVTIVPKYYCLIFSRDLRGSDANGFVQRAISAANVYNNIVKYIHDANITSLTTLNLSQRAEDVRYFMTAYGKVAKVSRFHCVCLVGYSWDTHTAWTPGNTERQCFQGIHFTAFRTNWYQAFTTFLSVDICIFHCLPNVKCIFLIQRLKLKLSTSWNS